MIDYETYYKIKDCHERQRLTVAQTARALERQCLQGVDAGRSRHKNNLAPVPGFSRFGEPSDTRAGKASL
jgi:hypothetical protein